MIDARNINDLAARIKQLGMGIQSGQIEGTAQNVMHLMHLKEELQKARAMQNSAMANAPKPPTVMSQVASSAVQDADQAQAQSVQDMMKQRALAMQGEMAGTGGLGSFVKEPEKKMALGGAVAFSEGNVVPDIGAIYEKMANGVPLEPEEQALLSRRPSKLAQIQKLPINNYITPVPKGVDIQAPAVQTVVPKQIQPIAQTNIDANQPTTSLPTSNIGFNQPTAAPALPSRPASVGFNGSEFDKALSDKTPEEDYRKRMEDYLGPNTGIESLRGKLSKMEAESVSDKEKAPWMALMKAGLATMAGTSPYALTNIGKGAQEGVADYIDAQKEFRKAQEKQFEIQSQLEAAQRRERSDIFKYGAESKRADQSNDRTVELAKASAENQYKLHQLDNEVQMRGQDISAGNAANSLALRKQELEYSEPYQRAVYADLFTQAQNEKDPTKKAFLESKLKGMEQSHANLNQYRGLNADNKLALDYENEWQKYLSGKEYADLERGMSKNDFINMLKGASSTSSNQQFKTSSGTPYSIRG